MKRQSKFFPKVRERIVSECAVNPHRLGATIELIAPKIGCLRRFWQ